VDVKYACCTSIAHAAITRISRLVLHLHEGALEGSLESSIKGRGSQSRAQPEEAWVLEEVFNRESAAREPERAEVRNTRESGVRDRRLGGWRTKGGAIPMDRAAKRDCESLSAAERVVWCWSDGVESVEPDFVLRGERTQKREVVRDVCARNQKGRAQTEAITRFGRTPSTFRGAGDECSIRQCHALRARCTDDRE
jgi:hypothetical protein